MRVPNQNDNVDPLGLQRIRNSVSCVRIPFVGRGHPCFPLSAKYHRPNVDWTRPIIAPLRHRLTVRTKSVSGHADAGPFITAK